MNGKPMPQVVIVGAGFGGLNAALKLAHAPVQITLIDRRNHHTFQPLLYQVATAGLSPGEIAAPIRWILGGCRNIEVLLEEVHEFDLERRVVKLAERELPYDYLIVAAGASHAYFGHDEWEPLAPGLKTVEDATEIRSRLLVAFERAEREPDAEKRRTWLNFVFVEGEPRVLPTFPPDLSAKAEKQLIELGVQARTGARVTAIDAGGVTVKTGEKEERIA